MRNHILAEKTLHVFIVFAVILLCGCSGKIAKTGCATIKNVNCDGIMTVQYADGMMKLKRLDQANLPSDIRRVKENLFKPVKYVETVKGGTLTFPEGDTIICHDVKREKGS
jgi:hypothetical protein